jgi:indolepyruvate ferredoxin oxidoreductase alpha subunit
VAERSFSKEVEALKLGDGEIFRGEGILAVTKALLQAGVSYVGGYQGAPVSHLLDVMVDAEDYLSELGVHVETCTNEASAAAMLGASINYPLRGAVTWKSIVGTNVAADALSNLSSPGVIGGALIILGEDYGEGSSVIQERSYAYAMKSSMWLLDPRPDLPTIVRTVEKGFELSEASHAPVMMELRVRACHVTGEFPAKTNKRPQYSTLDRLPGPAEFNYNRLAHPPVIFPQERQKFEDRLPAAQKFIREHKLNELFAGEVDEIGVIVLGGLYNALMRALARLGLADLYGATRVPIYCLNAAYPLVPEELKGFCSGKRAVLVIEEGSPEYVEQQINVELRRADIQTRVYGKGVLPKTGDYTSDILQAGLAAFIAETRPRGVDADALQAKAQASTAHKPDAIAAVGELPPRPPTFCTGCPERPVFSAIKLAQRELGPTHISADIGCHSFGTFAPFSFGNSILGFGMSLASAAAVAPNLDRRPISIMGDGGFWHNGMITGVASNVLNKSDGVLIIMQNGYTSATGQQYIVSSATSRQGGAVGGDIENALRALGIKWLRKVRTYSVATMAATLKEAMRAADKGLKVIIADGECQLARQRRLRVENAEKLKRGERVLRTRYGVDDEICTGDHSCIRLSGCPSLTVKPSPDPLRTDPVATVIESCVGCGLCGEVAHAAVLCPSFYRADIVQNPGWWDRKVFAFRRLVLRKILGGGVTRPALPAAAPRHARQEQAPASSAAQEPPAVAAKTPRPITILIAALGGEGGGVLTNWIVNAAAECGFPVQSTSIPGVAQRTGATTYYIEIFPKTWKELRGERPILALAPGAGDVDLVVASELLEAGRQVANGFVTSDRSTVIASTSRFYAMNEKIAMGDGRYDQERLLRSIEQHAESAVLFDMEALAKQSGAVINSVMLGAIAASGRLPIALGIFENAIRAEGKAADINLRGFHAGLEAVRAGARALAAPPGKRPSALTVEDLEREIAASMPAAAHDVLVEGVRRLVAYQNAAYARLYLDRLQAVREADLRSGSNGRLLRETARHLAVRMSFEDVIRVAQAKIDPARFVRILADMKIKPGEPYTVTEFLKPGIEELCSVLPPFVASPIIKFAERRGWLGKVYFGMHINSASVSGYLRFWLLARLRGLRPRSWRFQQEQAAIEAWIGLICKAAQQSPAVALEIAECARLIKGYGDTHKRGTQNFKLIGSR